MFRMLIYWECVLLQCKCICIVKLCLCRERNSFYSLVLIENAFWCNLSAFTFSASLPLNECLWITFPASLSLFLSRCMHTFQFLVCLHVQEKNKNKFPSEKNFLVSSLPIEQFCKTEQSLSLNRALSNFDLENWILEFLSKYFFWKSGVSKTRVLFFSFLFLWFFIFFKSHIFFFFCTNELFFEM